LVGRLLRWTAGTAVLVAALGGCAGGGSTAQAGKSDPKDASASTSPSTGRSAQPVGAITQDRMQGALLSDFQGLTPITPPQNGSYDSLPAAEIAGSTQQTPPGAAFKPAKCKSAIWSGPDTKQFGKAAATVTAFRKPGDTSPGGVQAWEELVASSGQSRQAALGTGPVGGCDTVRVSAKGNTLTFAEQRTPSLGKGSRGALLTPSSSGSRPTWVATFVGNGYVGVVFLQGPVKKSQLDAFASAAYKNASEKLG
jgi:hypothetical protein